MEKHTFYLIIYQYNSGSRSPVMDDRFESIILVSFDSLFFVNSVIV